MYQFVKPFVATYVIGNLGLLAGILSAVGLLALLATIVTALLIRRS